MATTNWEKLKLEFLISEHTTVTGFFQDKDLSYNGHSRSKTKGWIKEKKKYQKETTEEVKKQMIKKKGELLSGTLDLIVRVLSNRVIHKPNELSHSELKSTWEILRTEMGLPTKINKAAKQNYNPLADEEALDKIHDDIMKLYKKRQSQKTS